MGNKKDLDMKTVMYNAVPGWLFWTLLLLQRDPSKMALPDFWELDLFAVANIFPKCSNQLAKA